MTTYNERLAQNVQHKTLHEKYIDLTKKYNLLHKKYQKLYYQKKSLDQKNHLKILALTKQVKREHFEENISSSTFGDNLKNYLEAYSGEDLTLRCRRRELIEVRGVFFYLMRKYTNKSLFEISSYVGGLNHATLIHSLNMVQDLVATNKTFKADLDKHEQYVLITLLKPRDDGKGEVLLQQP